MRLQQSWLLILLGLLTTTATFAHIDPNNTGQRPGTRPVTNTVNFRESCDNAIQQIDQAINNVRARLTTGGDVWWDGNNGRYVIPKPPPGVPEVSSIFAGAVWIGGKEPGGGLKLAAQSYGRSSGSFDFYPGPLVPEGFINQGTTSKDTCARWDRFFVVSGESIRRHIGSWRRALAEGRSSIDQDEIPRDVLGWPGAGNRFFAQINQFPLPNTSQGLAGFWDQNLNGIYEPDLGDYPIIEIRGCLDKEPLGPPDEMIFWIYNDAGNAHQESGSPNVIQMEIQVQAFAYKTNDDINNMTFQRYKLINRAVDDIKDTYFAIWVDADLGCYLDDFIGCDVSRSLAYVYNADQLDGQPGCTCPGGVNTYCDEIPILGVDYFRGPLDEFGEEIGMSSFTYNNNGGTTPTPAPQTTDPDRGNPQQYYNYISGRWKDGTPVTRGGTGYNVGSTDVIPYAFPDSPNDPSGWSMSSAGLPVGDRRTLQASGPFTLKPGAVNELIIGAVWVADQVYPNPSIARLQKADDIAQDLFDNCFDLPRGPDAPDVDWIELDREIIAVFTNDTIVQNSNNAFEAYAEEGLGLPQGVDSIYRFEGYKLYQFSGPEASLADVDDPSKVRLVYQVDVKNGVSKIFNWQGLNPEDGGTPTEEVYFVPELKVDGADLGIRHTFRITTDQFAEGDNRLVNHRKYYFTAVAYAYNNYKPFDPTNRLDPGQDKPYLEGSRNIGDGENPYYTVIPRPIVDRKLNARYGEGAVITRIDGEGTGAGFLDISDAGRQKIESSFGSTFDGEIEYKPGFGPIDVKIFNPLDVIDGEYEVTMVDENMANNRLDNTVRWVLRNISAAGSPVIISERTINQPNEQIIRQYGLAINIYQVQEPGADKLGSNGARGASISYPGSVDPVQWALGVRDGLAIQTGNPTLDFNIFNYVPTGALEPLESDDPRERYTSDLMAPNHFVPYYLCGWLTADTDGNPISPYIGPAWQSQGNRNGISHSQTSLATLNNVDIVLTSNKDLWSRCVIIETANQYITGAGFTTEGAAGMFDLRRSPSVTKFDNDNNGRPDPDPSPGTGQEIGMGWFPGYAVDVETGQRLNIFFGENSTYDGTLIPEANNGRDMMWNPSDIIYRPIEGAFPTAYNYVAGGHHFIYVTKTAYDECALFRERFGHPSALRKISALNEITWAGFIMAAPGQRLRSYKDGLIPQSMIYKLRVDNSYAVKTGSGEFNGYPTYRFKIEGKSASALDSEGVATALDAINVVPNPYYGFSEYEDSQFETVIKITNLPAKCVVTIYTLDGKFVRQYNRDERGIVPEGNNRAIDEGQIIPALEWDLKNSKGIPVASGMYLIHVAAEGLGERTIKWLGVNRQFDPSGL
jgi:hypothetical protein